MIPPSRLSILKPMFALQVQNDLGVAKYEADDVQGALAAFGKALILDPTDRQAQENSIALRAFLAP